MAVVKRDLGNVRGIQGPVGPTGKDANIDSVTITLDGTHKDKPTAEVVMGGEPGNQTMSISFVGLTGPKGDHGDYVPKGTTDQIILGDGSCEDISELLKDNTSSVAMATVESAGIVKPDGTTIKISDDGTISVNELPEKELSEDDYIVIQAQGGDTSRARIGIDGTDEFGLVTTGNLDELIRLKADVIREAIGLATTDHIGLVPRIPEE